MANCKAHLIWSVLIICVMAMSTYLMWFFFFSFCIDFQDTTLYCYYSYLYFSVSGTELLTAGMPQVLELGFSPTSIYTEQLRKFTQHT